MNLYQIAAEYRESADTLAALDIDPQTLADTLESISGDLTTKTQNIAFVIRNLEALAESIKQAANGMTGRAKAIEARAASLRQYVLDNMMFAGVQKIDTPYFALAVRKNPPSAKVEDERQIPPRFFEQPPTPPLALSKSALAEALKAGEIIPGAKLVQSRRLEIR